MEDVNKPRQIFLFLSKLECCSQEINSREFAYLLHFRQIGLNATKLEKLARIHFSCDVFAAFAVVDANAPTEIKRCVKVMQLHRIRCVKRYIRQDRLYWKISALNFFITVI